MVVGSSWLMSTERLCLSSFLGTNGCVSPTPASLGHHLSPQLLPGCFFLGFLWWSLSGLCLCEGLGGCPRTVTRASLGLPPLAPCVTFKVCWGGARFLWSPSPPDAAVSAAPCPQQRPILGGWMLGLD